MKNHGKLEFMQFTVSIIKHTNKQSNRNYHYSNNTKIDSSKTTNRQQQAVTGTMAELASTVVDVAAAVET